MDSVDNYKSLLVDVLLRKAKGFVNEEKTEEFAVVDGELTLVKRKIVTKQVLPDLNAIKALIELDGQQTDVTQMTDEQLRQEKVRLLQLLRDTEQSDKSET